MSTAPRSHGARRDWGDDDAGASIIHLDMDCFFASVERAERPELAHAPVIVGGRGNRGVVTSATYDVRARGVHAGQPLARARALCPEAVVLPVRHDLYGRYSARVMAILREATPLVEQLSIDEAFLDVSGSTLRLGSPTRIARDLRRRIRAELGLPSSAGIAGTKSVAKIASGQAKPDGLLLVPLAQTVPFLRSLPVGALWGVGRRTQDVLAREGVETVAQLAGVAPRRLERLVGQAAARTLRDLANGVDPRAVTPLRVEKSVGTETTFDSDQSSRAALERYVLAASHKCARRLRERACVGWTVSIKMRDVRFRTITRSATLPAPTDLGRDVSAAALRLLAAERIPSGGVRLLGVRVEGLSARSAGVPVPLDEDPRPEASEKAMDDVAHRFGEDAIVPASLLGAPRAIRRVPGGAER